MAKRIQRKRSKGWRMPAGAVYVGRGSQWGNPYTVENTGRVDAVLRFACEVAPLLPVQDLRGKDLACWCRLCDAHKAGKPFGTECDACDSCHADVLGDMANR